MSSILPQGKTQFFDRNGKPLAGCSVYFYEPGTTTFKNTYQDQALTILNTNPVILDARGEAAIWGSGSYRQIVQDFFGATIYDVVTSSPLGANDTIPASSVILTSGKTVQEYLDVLPVPLYATQYGFTGVGDESALWTAFCAEKFKDKYLDLDISIHSEGILADNTNITFLNGAKITLNADVAPVTASGSEGECLVAGLNSVITNAYIDGVDGSFFNGAGVLVTNTSGVTVSDGKFVHTSTIAIKAYKSTNVVFRNNYIYGARHGILLWLTNYFDVGGNHVERISHPTQNNGGGIWTAVGCYGIIHDNYVTDCADVGVDLEGGTTVVAQNNVVIRCAHGELTVFATGTEDDLQNAGVVMGNLVFRGNTTWRDAYAYDRSGNAVQNALTDIGSEMIYGGLDTTQSGPISFLNNTINVIATTGSGLFAHRSRTSLATGQAVIVQRGCTYRTLSGRSVLWYDRQDHIFKDCDIRYEGVTVAVGLMELRDVRTVESDNIRVYADPSVTITTYMFVVNNSQLITSNVLYFARWTFTGKLGNLFRIDQTFTARTVVIEDFRFPDAGGGTTIPISIGAGIIRWKNQKFNYLMTPAASFNFATGIFYQSDAISVNAYTALLLDNKKKCVYRFMIENDLNDTMYLTAIDAGGSANTGLRPNASCYATFSGTTITYSVVSGVTSVLSALINLEVNSVTAS
jgi:hypothetical protein